MVFNTNIELINTSLTLSTKSDVYLVDATNGNITITLPNILSNGMQYKLKRTDNTTNTVTIQATGGQLINNNSTFTLYPLNSCEIYSYNLQWYIVSNLTRSLRYGLTNFIYYDENSNVNSSYIYYTNNNIWLSISNFVYNGSIINKSLLSSITVIFNTSIDIGVPYTIRLIEYGTTNIIATQTVIGGPLTQEPTLNTMLLTINPLLVPLTESILEFQLFIGANNNGAYFKLYSINYE